MALSWGLACGFDSLLAYFYVLFFTVMILHRQRRDEARCRAKYGEHWEEYVRRVPNVFVPSGSFFVMLLDQGQLFLEGISSRWLLVGAGEREEVCIPVEKDPSERGTRRRKVASHSSPLRSPSPSRSVTSLRKQTGAAASRKGVANTLEGGGKCVSSQAEVLSPRRSPRLLHE